ncbi:hypothetical protein C6974_28820, partial [Escherichia coli]
IENNMNWCNWSYLKLMLIEVLLLEKIGDFNRVKMFFAIENNMNWCNWSYLKLMLIEVLLLEKIGDFNRV